MKIGHFIHPELLAIRIKAEQRTTEIRAICKIEPDEARSFLVLLNGLQSTSVNETLDSLYTVFRRRILAGATPRAAIGHISMFLRDPYNLHRP